MRIALAQTNPTVGDIAGNAAAIARMIARARDGGADCVLFPELAICGYPPRDLLLQGGFLKACTDAAKEIGACRAEAGLQNLPDPKSGVSWDFASCISNYLCGPDRETYLETMERCCRGDWNQSGDYCRGLRDPPPDTVPRLFPTR